MLEQHPATYPSLFFSYSPHFSVLTLVRDRGFYRRVKRVLTVRLPKRVSDSWHILLIKSPNIYSTSTRCTVLSARYKGKLEYVLLAFFPHPMSLHDIVKRKLQYFTRRINNRSYKVQSEDSTLCQSSYLIQTWTGIFFTIDH